MKNLIPVILGIVLILIFGGGAVISAFYGAGTTAYDTGSKIIGDNCDTACKNHFNPLPLGCSCPNPTAEDQANITLNRS